MVLSRRLEINIREFEEMREEIVRGESDPLIQNSCSFDFLILNLKLLKSSIG